MFDIHSQDILSSSLRECLSFAVSPTLASRPHPFDEVGQAHARASSKTNNLALLKRFLGFLKIFCVYQP